MSIDSVANLATIVSCGIELLAFIGATWKVITYERAKIKKEKEQEIARKINYLCFKIYRFYHRRISELIIDGKYNNFVNIIGTEYDINQTFVKEVCQDICKKYGISEEFVRKFSRVLCAEIMPYLTNPKMLCDAFFVGREREYLDGIGLTPEGCYCFRNMLGSNKNIEQIYQQILTKDGVL